MSSSKKEQKSSTKGLWRTLRKEGSISVLLTLNNKTEKSWFIDELSNAYFVSRYFPKEYSEETVKTMIDETKELLMTLEDISGEKILD